MIIINVLGSDHTNHRIVKNNFRCSKICRSPIVIIHWLGVFNGMDSFFCNPFFKVYNIDIYKALCKTFQKLEQIKSNTFIIIIRSQIWRKGTALCKCNPFYITIFSSSIFKIVFSLNILSNPAHSCRQKHFCSFPYLS